MCHGFLSPDDRMTHTAVRCIGVWVTGVSGGQGTGVEGAGGRIVKSHFPKVVWRKYFCTDWRLGAVYGEAKVKVGTGTATKQRT